MRRVVIAAQWRHGLGVIATVTLLGAAPLAAAQPAPEGTLSFATRHGFTTLAARVERAVEANGLAVVASASASRGAAARGIKIPGNAVIMAFRNDYAVRILKASVAAGIEAPVRLYVTESADGTARLTYRRPSALFAPYGSAELDRLADELDAVFVRIVRDAIASGA
jgi:uncharacterized protein (DUF302 family)